MATSCSHKLGIAICVFYCCAFAGFLDLLAACDIVVGCGIVLVVSMWFLVLNHLDGVISATGLSIPKYQLN